MEPLGDAVVGRYGGQLLINIPKPVVEYLKLRPTTLNIVSRGSDYVVLGVGPGPIKVLNVGGKLRIYAPRDVLPLREGDRVLVSVRGGDIVIRKIDYYVVRPSIKEGNYYRVNIPWELVSKLGLHKHKLLKIYEREGKVIIEPLEQTR